MPATVKQARLASAVLLTALLVSTLPEAVVAQSMRIQREPQGLFHPQTFQVEARPQAPRQESMLETNDWARPAPARPAPAPEQAYTPPPQGVPSKSSFSVGLSDREVNMLSQREVVLVVDRSGSMTERDCPPGLGSMVTSVLGFSRNAMVSRWDWCQNQVLGLTRQLYRVSPRGITLVLFASDAHVFPNAGPAEVERAFLRNQPGGSSNAADALKKVLDGYFKRRDAGQPVRPLSIAIITDGAPNNSGPLTDTIVNASKRARGRGEIAITFLQVGVDRDGSKLLYKLDNQIARGYGASDIVDVRPFAHVLQAGLGRSLVETLQADRRMPALSDRRY